MNQFIKRLSEDSWFDPLKHGLMFILPVAQIHGSRFKYYGTNSQNTFSSTETRFLSKREGH